MSLVNFKPTLWEDSIIGNFHDTSFVGAISTPPVETQGEKVIFNRMQAGVWKDYISGSAITWDAVATSKVELTFPMQKYFAFMVEDVDKVQLKGDVLDAVTKEQSGALGEEVDQEVVTYLASNVSLANTIGTAVAAELVTDANAYDMLVKLNTLANKAKIPVTDRHFIISPDFLGLLAGDPRFTTQYTILQNGIVEGAKVNGSTLIVKADNPTDKVILTHPSGTGYGMQLSGTPEAVRLQDFIADGVRGLVKYGYIKLRDESTCMAYIKYI